MAVALALLLFAASAAAQNPESGSTTDPEKPKTAADVLAPPALSVRKHNIRLNAVDLFLGGYGADMDFLVWDGLTAGPSLSYVLTSYGGKKISAIRAGGRSNFYFGRKSFDDGWYVSLYGMYISVSAAIVNGDTEGAGDSAGGYAGGLLLGRRWVWESGLNVSVGAGGTYYSTSSALGSETDGISTPWFTGALPAAEVCFGYAF
ncbi:MAG: hypothetical protein A2583_06490 [Bdellovibrionales bacterium RIFOXYD1_FULL_53_11]|nr:MAG: hypothetical protein A2583_06490 [Bdellovibrionales bacterium RIFOXYD1_FULL_53_11]